MTIFELEEGLLEGHFRGEVRDFLSAMDDLLDNIENEGIEEYRKEVKERAVKYGYCPHCYGRLVPCVVGVDIGEAEEEERVSNICEDCGLGVS